jgi:hypothetical protein
MEGLGMVLTPRDSLYRHPGYNVRGVLAKCQGARQTGEEILKKSGMDKRSASGER